MRAIFQRRDTVVDSAITASSLLRFCVRFFHVSSKATPPYRAIALRESLVPRRSTPTSNVKPSITAACVYPIADRVSLLTKPDKDVAARRSDIFSLSLSLSLERSHESVARISRFDPGPEMKRRAEQKTRLARRRLVSRDTRPRPRHASAHLSQIRECNRENQRKRGQRCERCHSAGYARLYARFAAGDRQREKEAILRALLGRKPFWGLVLLINEPLESACTFLRFVRRE